MNLDSLSQQFISAVSILAYLLFASYGLSLLARFHWLPDIFSHFAIQYAIGGLILGIALLVLQNYPLAVLCFAITIANAVEIRMLMQDPWNFSRLPEQSNFTMVQFNKYFLNPHYELMREWFESEDAKDIDLVIVQESGAGTIVELQQFRDLFPYQFPENSEDRFNDISVISRYPVTVERLPLTSSRYAMVASRITIQKENFAKPVVIYSYHTITPMTRNMQERRNMQLLRLAENVRKDPSPQVIASGDWNITPYSPYFDDFLKASGMKYQNFGLLPETSWISMVKLPFLMIPIDQVTYKDGMELTDIKRGPSMGSDHHSLMAKFKIEEK